jgi:patatin-like phospholipase/acyl hydrolase
MIQSEKVLSGFGIPSFKNELMKAIIESPHFPTHSVIETLKRHYRDNGHFHYFLDLFKLLSMENDGRSNLEVSIRSAFVESETELSVFLSDIIQKISIKPSYTLSE